MRSRSLTGPLLLGSVAALIWTIRGLAQTPDPALALRATPSEIAIEANGSTLGQIFDRLFTERGIPVEWHDEALAGKEIEGSFRGSIVEVTQRLLADENYIALTATRDGKPHIVRLIILGRGSPAQITPRLVEAQVAYPLPLPPGLPPKAGRSPARKMPR